MLYRILEAIPSREQWEQIKAQQSEASAFERLVPEDAKAEVDQLSSYGFRYMGVRLCQDAAYLVYQFDRMVTPFEAMGDFFDRRALDYDQHMRHIDKQYETNLKLSAEFIVPTLLPIRVLDLGCGTGAEIQFVFQQAPNAVITCVDMSREMLALLTETYCTRKDQLDIRCDSYLTMAFSTACYDAVIACNTLHHLLREEKQALFARLHTALKPGGLLIIDDYYVGEEEEASQRTKLLTLLETGAIIKGQPYHIDIPLTAEHEREIAESCGFTDVRIFGDDSCVVGKA